jgi:glycolate oxidase
MNIDVLRGLFGQDRCLTSREDLIPYGFDGTAQLFELPAAVVFPESTAEVVEVVRWARDQRVPVVTRGSGTGLSGGSVPVAGGVVLCTVRMNRILEVDTRNLTLRAQTGAVTQEVAAAAEKEGLFYPPDPGSMKISTIGGNVAENSGGLRGLKYGVTKDYVMGLEVVLADGSVLRTGTKCVKDVAGYSLKDLFIGSEGCFGIITEVLLKVIPHPASKRTLLAVYDRLTDAAETVSAIIAGKIIPCTLEFMDRVTIGCIEDYARIGLPTDAEAILLMETDGHPAATADEAEAMRATALRHGAREVKLAASPEESLKLASARRTAFSALARIRPTTILEDATVPRSELARMVEFIGQVGRKYELKIGTFGHMGDGNLHPTFLTDERDHAEIERVEKAMEEIFLKAVELGGTITGEHGVGLAKKSFLARTLDPASLDAMRRLRRAFDPEGILNPGKVL